MAPTSADLMEFLEQRREQSYETEDFAVRAWFLLDTLALAYGEIDETNLRLYLESAGVVIGSEVEDIISLYASTCLEVHNQWKVSCVHSHPWNYVDDRELFDKLDQVKFDGKFLREYLC